MRKKVLIAGAGNLGSRYLQGLSGCAIPLEIYVSDPSPSAKSTALSRWNEVASAGSAHSLHLTNPEPNIEHIDLAIVATNADVRSVVVDNLNSAYQIQAWLIEKVIAQSDDDLKRIVASTAYAESVFVNLPRCIMPWYRDIRDRLSGCGKMNIRISGGRWGLACNSIHHLHLCSFLTGEEMTSVNLTAPPTGSWYETKRPGFYDFLGTIEAEYSGGSRVEMVSSDCDDEFRIRLSQEIGAVDIYEERGFAEFPNGDILTGALQYQSQMTGSLVESILTGKGCGLPKLREVEPLQSELLKVLRHHWNRSFGVDRDAIPVT